MPAKARAFSLVYWAIKHEKAHASRRSNGPSERITIRAADTHNADMYRATDWPCNSAQHTRDSAFLHYAQHDAMYRGVTEAQTKPKSPRQCAQWQSHLGPRMPPGLAVESLTRQSTSYSQTRAHAYPGRTGRCLPSHSRAICSSGGTLQLAQRERHSVPSRGFSDRSACDRIPIVPNSFNSASPVHAGLCEPR